MLSLIGVSISFWLLAVVVAARRQSQKLGGQIAERAAELRRLDAAILERGQAVAHRAPEAHFSMLFRLVPDAVFLSAGPRGPILDVNEPWQALFGYERAEAIGNTAAQLDLYVPGTKLAAILEGDWKQASVRDIEVELRDRAGRTRTALFSGGMIDAGDVPCFVAIFRDITEQHRAEDEARKQREQLALATRAAALGKLSGALAHELNQPLAAILTNAQAARRFMSRPPVDLKEIREILDDIVAEDKRAGEVIRRLRALFMKGEAKMQPLAMNELVRDTLALIHSDLIERKVPVVLALDSGPGMVQGDRVQLQQVLINLIVNACEAMSAGPSEDRRLCLATGAESDGHFRVEVADTGPGIAPEIIDRIFESFFTTKTHGMGFGLSISRAIVAEHGGSIEAANNPNGGATFRIILPPCPGALP